MTSRDGPRFGAESPNYSPRIAFLAAVSAALAGVAVCTAAILVPAPTSAVPVAVLIGAGCPFFAGFEARSALASRRRHERSREKALARLRSQLARLPETEHPLGL